MEGTIVAVAVLAFVSGIFIGRMLGWYESELQYNDHLPIFELQAGGNCGCCGAWVKDAVVEKAWPWTVCDKCNGEEPNVS